ncbi:Nuclear autoantigenic sperm protein [Nymphaea thermarum]|nr:Nuclear autoantigenic sperm protein [Nymphaea thermarum]
MEGTEQQENVDLSEAKVQEAEADRAAAVQPEGEIPASEPSPAPDVENGHVKASSLLQKEGEGLAPEERQGTLGSAPVVEDDAGSEVDAPEDDAEGFEEDAEGGEVVATDGGSPAKTLKYADKLMQEGLDGMKSKDYSLAIDRFSRALEIRVDHFGELSPECAQTYYKYGCALLYKAQDENEALALGDAVTKKTSAGRRKLGDGEGSSHGSEKIDVKSNNKLGKRIEGDGFYFVKCLSMREMVSARVAEGHDSVEKENENAGDDVEDVEIGEEEESDLDLAFSMLDIARVIVEKNVSGDTMEKVDIISALGDVSLEREDIQTCLEDYRRALSMLERLVEPDNRLLAEIHFKLCMALQMDNKIIDAIVHCEAAVSACEAKCERLKMEVANSCGASSMEKDEEIKTLEQLLVDLNAKLEDLRDLPAMPTLAEMMADFKTGAQGEKTGASSAVMTEAFTGSSGTDVPVVSATGERNQVVHLGIVGRGVKRATPIPVMPESPSKKPTVSTPDISDGCTGESVDPGCEISEPK